MDISNERNNYYSFVPRVFILGMPNVGKTSLSLKLVDSESDLAPSYDPSKWKINIKYNVFFRNKNTKPDYCIWDFDRPFVDFNVWKLFIAKGCLYIILIDSATNYEHGNINIWLAEIAKYCDKKQVFLVQNLTNNASSNILREVNDIYKSLIYDKTYEFNLDKISEKDYEKFDENIASEFKDFRRDVERELISLTLSALSEKEEAILDILQKKKITEPVIDIQYYTNACVQNNIIEVNEQSKLLRRISNYGVCTWYENIGILKRMIVLDECWLSKAVFGLIKKPESSNCKWLLTVGDIENVLIRANFKNHIDELLILIDNYNLIYKLDNNEGYIVPTNFIKNPPGKLDLKSIQEAKVSVYIKYKSFSQNVIIELILALYPQISGNKAHIWENGCGFNSIQGPSAIGAMELSYDNKELIIWTKGVGAAYLMQQILCELWKIHYRKNISPEFLIPCNCQKCCQAKKPKMFNYDEVLIEIFDNKRPGIRCPHANDDIPFDQLMGMVGFTKKPLPYNKDSIKHDDEKKRILKMKKNIWIPVLISTVIITLFLLWARTGSKLDFLGLFKVEQGTDPKQENIPPKALRQITVVGSVKINNRNAKAEEVKKVYIKSKGGTLVAPTTLSGNIFKLNSVEIPDDKIIEIALDLKGIEIPPSALFSVPDPNANNVSDLGEVLIEVTWPKPSKINGRKAPAMPNIVINNTNITQQK